MKIKTAIGEIEILAETLATETIISVVAPSGESIAEVSVTNEDVPEVSTFVYKEGEDSPVDVFLYNRI